MNENNNDFCIFSTKGKQCQTFHFDWKNKAFEAYLNSRISRILEEGQRILHHFADIFMRIVAKFYYRERWNFMKVLRIAATFWWNFIKIQRHSTTILTKFHQNSKGHTFNFYEFSSKFQGPHLQFWQNFIKISKVIPSILMKFHLKKFDEIVKFEGSQAEFWWNFIKKKWWKNPRATPTFWKKFHQNWWKFRWGGDLHSRSTSCPQKLIN